MEKETIDFLEDFQYKVKAHFKTTNVKKLAQQMKVHFIKDNNALADKCVKTKCGIDVYCHIMKGEKKDYSLLTSLGHLFLHAGYMTDEKLWESKEEFIFPKVDMLFQAAYFARAFLMPRDEVEKFCNSKVVDVRKGAKHFKVDESLFRMRVDELL